MNTRSSTEAELVGSNDAMSPAMWHKLFIEAQNHRIDEMKLYRDNTSCMQLETHGRRSTSQRTKHLHVRYFYITDRIKNNDLSIEFCPTEDMVADFFTKPLQGETFRKFRRLIMNIPEGNEWD